MDLWIKNTTDKPNSACQFHGKFNPYFIQKIHYFKDESRISPGLDDLVVPYYVDDFTGFKAFEKKWLLKQAKLAYTHGLMNGNVYYLTQYEGKQTFQFWETLQNETNANAYNKVYSTANQCFYDINLNAKESVWDCSHGLDYFILGKNDFWQLLTTNPELSDQTLRSYFFDLYKNGKLKMVMPPKTPTIAQLYAYAKTLDVDDAKAFLNMTPTQQQTMITQAKPTMFQDLINKDLQGLNLPLQEAIADMKVEEPVTEVLPKQMAKTFTKASVNTNAFINTEAQINQPVDLEEDFLFEVAQTVLLQEVNKMSLQEANKYVNLSQNKSVNLSQDKSIAKTEPKNATIKQKRTHNAHW